MKKFFNLPTYLLGILAVVAFYIVFTSTDRDTASTVIGGGIIAAGVIVLLARKK
ncbi:MAG: hypothetical protein ACRC5C_12925 [Bacilli bacterium]